MPHDGWRQFLPYVISQYKNGAASVSTEGLVSVVSAPAGHGVLVWRYDWKLEAQWPANRGAHTVVQDKIFYSALLSSPATVSVSIGGDEHPVLGPRPRLAALASTMALFLWMAGQESLSSPSAGTARQSRCSRRIHHHHLHQ